MDVTSPLRLPAPRILASRSVSTWLAIGSLCAYLAFCWFIYVFTVEPMVESLNPYSIAADSGAYYQAANVYTASNADPTAVSNQVSLGGSVIGPAIVATIFRNPFGVALFNCALFGLTIYVVGAVPGLKRGTFTVLMIINALTLPALMTLNKEILALAGMAFFAKYLYSRSRPFWLLSIVIILSTMGRWQQTAFIFIFLTLRSRFLPFRTRPKLGIAALVVFLSGVWALLSWRFSNLLSAYMALQEEINGGTIARLNAIQAKGGFLLVVWPKILMNVSGRILQVHYFLTEWIHSNFHDLQNTVIGNLHSLVMLVLLGVMLFRGRFRLSRPLVHFALIYMILTAASPLVQNRYEYPAYALLAMEMSRRKESLEPAKPFRKLPELAPSYQAFQHGASGTIS